MKRMQVGSRTLHVTLAAACLTLAIGVVAAQELTEISIEVARTTKIVGHSSTTGAPVELVTLTRHVTFSDLDLKSHAGAMALERRVQETAKSACAELDKLYPLDTPDAPSCTKKATDGAMVQVHAAIAAAEKRSE